jgi:predicted esterase
MRRQVSLLLPCEYLLSRPEESVDSQPAGSPLATAEQQPEGPGRPLLALAMHGYGQNPEDMLRLTRNALGPTAWIAALRGPHPFNLRPFSSDAKIGFNWGTSPVGWEEAIDLHHRYVLAVLDQLASEIGRMPERTLLVGFSQPVGMNYRFIATHPGKVRGVVAVCGGVPRDWEKLATQPVRESILHISRSEDEFYPVEKAESFAPRLRAHAGDVEFHLIPGRHRFPSNARDLVAPWLDRVFGG